MPLPACPESPNCVCSCNGDNVHAIAPIVYQGESDAALKRIKAVILDLPRTRLSEENDSYLHFEFRSWLMNYIDDVELAVDDTEKVLHIRSASRTGYYDLGVNRRRVERIRKHFNNI